MQERKKFSPLNQRRDIKDLNKGNSTSKNKLKSKELSVQSQKEKNIRFSHSNDGMNNAYNPANDKTDQMSKGMTPGSIKQSVKVMQSYLTSIVSQNKDQYGGIAGGTSTRGDIRTRHRISSSISGVVSERSSPMKEKKQSSYANFSKNESKTNVLSHFNKNEKET